MISSVHKVSQKQVIDRRRRPGNVEDLQQIIELPIKQGQKERKKIKKRKQKKKQKRDAKQTR
jgi:hypothetical protein